MIRPPKAIHEPLFVKACDACGECIELCETGVLTADVSGRPVLDFHKAQCTFCGACAKACPAPAFEVIHSRDWTVTARITNDCLNVADVTCRHCLVACEAAAIRFAPRLGGSFIPVVVDEMCIGCGACVSVCPARSIVAELGS